MLLIAGLATAAFHRPAHAQAAPPHGPVEIVNRFLSLLESDETAAGAMMTTDFTIGAGDVGGNANVGELRPLMHAIGADCRLVRLALDDRPRGPMPAGISVVVGQYHCVTHERPDGHDIAINYLVQGDGISGLYMHDSPAPR